MSWSRSDRSECDSPRSDAGFGASGRARHNPVETATRGRLLAELDAVEADVRAADVRIRRLRRNLSRLLPA